MRRLVVLTLALGIALIPCSVVGQEEGRGGARTGVLVGTAASSLAMTGLCAGGGYLVVEGIWTPRLPVPAAFSACSSDRSMSLR